MCRITEYENITIVQDNEEMASVEVKTDKGNMTRKKALMIADDEYNNQFTISILNLTEQEKESLFNLLDISLHGKFENRNFLKDKTMELENRIEVLEEALEGYPDGDRLDCEYDFHEAI